ncbi:MAG TPA: ATP-binding protein [Clostridiaceae bacterium]|nr:ATP-binding protein [Clostridiaceae bacterium]
MMRNIDQQTKKRLNRYYELLRQKAERIRDQKVNSIHQAYPEIKELENKRIQAGIAQVRNKISGFVGQNTLDLAEVDQELKSVLIAKNIPLDYSEPDYNCDICRDSGWIADGYCSCVDRVLIEINQQTNLYLPASDQTFANFDLNLFSNRKNPVFFQGQLSPREAMRGLRTIAKRYAENFRDNPENLYMFGTTGTGKTFLMSCIANELSNLGVNLVFIKAVKLFELMAQRRTLLNSYSPDPEEQDFINRTFELINNTELLCIDDIGLEAKGLLNTYSDLIVLLDDRYNAKLPVIMTGNLKPSELGEDYDERIQSRITGNFQLLMFEGPDVRTQTAKGRIEQDAD